MVKKFLLKDHDKTFFKNNGYIVFKNFFQKKKLEKACLKIPKIFNGIYDTGISPDKVKWDRKNKKKIPRQLCNVWKSDKILKKIITDENLAKIAAELMGWNGIKLGQDSLMWVPPKNGGVSMHQDNPYQDWHSAKKTITCVIALSKVNKNNSGLQFLKGSHLTGKHKPIKYFFNGNKFDYTIKNKKFINLKKICVEGDSGTISFHHGNTWHGSNINKSGKDRISISVHYIPLSSKYSRNISHSIYSHYRKFNTLSMDENYFPTLWSKSKKKRSRFLD